MAGTPGKHKVSLSLGSIAVGRAFASPAHGLPVSCEGCASFRLGVFH